MFRQRITKHVLFHARLFGLAALLLPLVLFNFAFGETGAGERVAPPPSSPREAALSLQEVLDIAVEANPNRAIFEANRAAAQAEILEALAYPNPEIEVEAGGAVGRESPRDTEAEFGVRLEQALEWPWKRQARKAVAEASREVVEQEQRGFGVTLRGEVLRAYWTARYQVQAFDLAEKNKQIALEIEHIVRRRVEGGEVPEIDHIRARIEHLKAARQRQWLKRRLATSRSVLNALCGGQLPAEFVPRDSMETRAAAMPLEDCLETALRDHPILKQWDASLRKSTLTIERERVNAQPDLRVGVFGGREFDTDHAGASVGIEIPLWNRNQAGIAAARSDKKRIQAEIERARVEIEREVKTAWGEYESAREQHLAFESGLRSAAEEALQIETSLYEQGETNFLQLLDARRTAQETETEYLQALYDVQMAKAHLEQAMGKGVEDQ